jgi:hypothetical protein
MGAVFAGRRHMVLAHGVRKLQAQNLGVEVHGLFGISASKSRMV